MEMKGAQIVTFEIVHKVTPKIVLWFKFNNLKGWSQINYW